MMLEATKPSITADSILEQSSEQRKVAKSFTLDILDLEELKDWQGRKRFEYEEALKRNRLDLHQWIRYAEFELQQHDVRRARSVYERALLVNGMYIPLWIRYIDSELKLKNVNHARNLLIRATNMLPKVDAFWYKYVFVEECLGHFELVRGIYIRWCILEPVPSVWDAFIDFESRHGINDHIRDIYSRYVMVHPFAETWLKWVKFEVKHGDVVTVRKVYSLGLDTFTSYSFVDVKEIERIIISFANWEASQQEYERSRCIYSIAQNKWPDSKVLKDAFFEFNKKFGDGLNLKDSVIFKRRRNYEEILSANSDDYDSWWLYLDLVEDNFSNELQTIFEKATVNFPKGLVKDIVWRRYIYIWIRFLAYLELNNYEVEYIRSKYKTLLGNIIPHKKFTFAKIWIMNAKFEIRQGDITRARKILGMSLGICPKNKLFRFYINLEIKLKEFDRVRKLFEKYIAFNCKNPNLFIEYAELEENLGDEDRARGIYEIGLHQGLGLSKGDRLQLLLRYIQFETDAGEYLNSRKLYDQYVQESDYNVKAWVKKALHELSIPTESQLASFNQRITDNGVEESDEEFEILEENVQQARQIFEEALKYFKKNNSANDRINILKALRDFENVHGTPESQSKVVSRFPSEIKNNVNVDGVKKEYIEYIFPDDSSNENEPNLSKLLSLARRWDSERTLK